MEAAGVGESLGNGEGKGKKSRPSEDPVPLSLSKLGLIMGHVQNKQRNKMHKNANKM